MPTLLIGCGLLAVSTVHAERFRVDVVGPDGNAIPGFAGFRYLLQEDTTYPMNPRMSGRWVRQGHRRFGRRTPLSIILNDGESGLIAVLAELDCTFSWDLTGSMANTSRPV